MYRFRPRPAALPLLLAAAVLLGRVSHAQTSLPELVRASKGNPTDPRLQNAIGIGLQQEGRSEESLAYFREALKLDPRYADAAHNLALALLAAGRPAEALDALNKHRFDSADHHALRGAVLNSLERASEAVVPLRRAVALEPSNADYVYDLAVLLLKTDASDEAAVLVRTARKRFPRSAKIHAVSGMLAYSKGGNAEAAQEYETATKLEPEAADLWAALGDVYAAVDNVSKAEAAYARAIQLDPGSAEYRVKSGRNLLKLQRSDEAEAAFVQALEMEPRDAEAHFQLGKLAAARGDDAAAIKYFEGATALQPSLKAAWYQVSISYRRSGQHEKAREALETFRKIQ